MFSYLENVLSELTKQINSCEICINIKLDGKENGKQCYNTMGRYGKKKQSETAETKDNNLFKHLVTKSLTSISQVYFYG